MWTVTFGPVGKTYLVHEGILKQSPVLGAMCEDGFLEAAKKRIDLPEEEASDFRHLISYLYRGDIDPLRGSKQHTKKSIDERAEELTCIYLLADKYLSDRLKERVVEELGKLADWKTQRREFVDIAKKFYKCNSPPDYIFRQFFQKTMDSLMTHMDVKDKEYLIEVVGEGGLLAEDMYAQMLVYGSPPSASDVDDDMELKFWRRGFPPFAARTRRATDSQGSSARWNVNLHSWQGTTLEL